MESANLELVRSIYAAWGRGDFSGADWADPSWSSWLPTAPNPAVGTG